MTNTPTTTDEKTKKLTKREESHVKELEHLAESLKKDNLLYGSALDGMAPAIKEASDALAGYDVDTKIASAEDEIAQAAADVLKVDISEVASTEKELDADDAEEDALLAEDEREPQESA